MQELMEEPILPLAEEQGVQTLEAALEEAVKMFMRAM
tara:strand:- start:153 stop:263 length:111 start_codon:yes stop_codon:yes gene_type:complete